MKFFITGATGFIGNRLALELAHQGHYVNALVRTKQKESFLKHSNIRIIRGDMTNINSLRKGIKEADGIFHLAALAKPWVKDKLLYNKINVESTHTILTLAKENRVKKIVFTSSAGTLGPSIDKPVNEETPRKTNFCNEYESTKFMAEKIAKDFVIQGLNVVIVHPSRVYGPGLLSKSNSTTIMIKNYTQGKWRIIPGNGKRIGNYVFIDDVIKGHMLAMEKGQTGSQYILGGENVSYITFFNTIKKLSNKKYRLLKIPVWILIAFAGLQMKLARLAGQSPLLPPKWVKKYMFNWELSHQKAAKELGYYPHSLESGIQKTLLWLNKIKHSSTNGVE